MPRPRIPIWEANGFPPKVVPWSPVTIFFSNKVVDHGCANGESVTKCLSHGQDIGVSLLGEALVSLEISCSIIPNPHFDRVNHYAATATKS